MVEASIQTQAAQLDTKRWLTLITLCATQFIVALDFSIVSVALPTIGRELGFATTADLQWVVTAFALPFAGLLLLCGRAGDLYGRKKIFLVGLVVFTVTSFLGGVAQTATQLLLARAGQGIGAAMLAPTALSLITTSFREGPQRERALGINGSVLSLGFVAGVILGGVITSGLSWRWTMLVNVPVGIVVFACAFALIKGSRRNESPQLDVPGAVLVTAGLASLVYGISTGETVGWTNIATVASLIGGLVLLLFFLAVERRVRAPLASLPLLNLRTVKWGNVIGFITFGMATGSTVLLTIYLQEVLGLTPLYAGLSFAPLGLAAILAGSLGPRLIARSSARTIMVVGLAVQAISTGMLYLLPENNPMALLLVAMAMLGFGHVLAAVGFVLTVTSGLPDEQQGLAGGLAQTFQQMGAAVGIPIIAAVAAAQGESADGDAAFAEVADVLNGTRAGGLAGAIILVIGVLIAFFLVPSHQNRTRSGRTLTE
ncbi:MAG: MFS transporter [Actinomycetota bacterium]|nr:MFS transporter [Actinomycetota bacterium]